MPLFVYINVTAYERKDGCLMEDLQILELFFARSEAAIQETDRKYGSYCYKIAFNILADPQDSEESVNDTYLSAWNSIPPRKPARLSTYLGKLTRNISIDRWRVTHAQKRGGGETPLALEELTKCVSGQPGVEEAIAQKEIAVSVNRFLAALPEAERTVFLCRYWYVNSMEEIAKKTGFSVGKVKSMLHRTRKNLAAHLQKEGLR